MTKTIYLILEVNRKSVAMAQVMLWSSTIELKVEHWRKVYGLRNHNYKIYYDMQSKMNDPNFVPFAK